jgi:hypothetical protein
MVWVQVSFGSGFTQAIPKQVRLEKLLTWTNPTQYHLYPFQSAMQHVLTDKVKVSYMAVQVNRLAKCIHTLYTI